VLVQCGTVPSLTAVVYVTPQVTYFEVLAASEAHFSFVLVQCGTVPSLTAVVYVTPQVTYFEVHRSTSRKSTTTTLPNTAVTDAHLSPVPAHGLVAGRVVHDVVHLRRHLQPALLQRRVHG
jgi:hypothetical protein